MNEMAGNDLPAEGPWVNHETANVADWLSTPAWERQLATVVGEWNGAGLLGVDLADALRGLVRCAALKRAPHEGADALLAAVDWGQLAENYALRFCGVGEAELTARREVLESTAG